WRRDELGAEAFGPGRGSGRGREKVFAAGNRVLQEPMYQVDVVAVELNSAGDLVARERPAMHDELEPEVLHGRTCAAGARGRGADVTKTAMEYAVRLAQPVGHPDVGAFGRATERVSLDLIDGELAA